jgi:hypothetical protein
MAMRVTDRMPTDDKLAQVRMIVHEFENYKRGAEGVLRERQSGWRALTTMQLH